MIDISSHRILVDGVPTLIMAGEVHYFRISREQWADRIDKLAEIGCTCVASYIPWLVHELPDGSIDVNGTSRPERDLGAFIDLCAERGLTFLARPGPFVMAELKNEGLPYRLYTDHPEIIPVGWDGAPAPTRTVDYLAEAFLAEVDRWFAAVIPILAERQHTRGGPVIGVQLDNEIGMLAWLSNSPDLTDVAVADLLRWCRARYGADLVTRYAVQLEDQAAWAHAVRSPAEQWAAALRVDLGWYSRERFARYVGVLADMARRYGLDGVPFLINIHGTEAGNGVPFAIGVSQLFESYAGRTGFVAGSDHYLGDMSLSVTTDIHFINAVMAAMNGADQPLTSLEFEAGTGDYSNGLDALYDASTVELKTRLCLAQGNRLINYYLMAGGINPPLDVPVGDGNDRISFTGERHGNAAPIGPLGERGLSFEATSRVARAAAANARWLADMDEEHDDLTIGFWPDAFMTENHHRGSAIMREIVEDLVAHRGPGLRKAMWRSLLMAGYRFTATNLQDAGAVLPGTVGLSTGTVLDAAVQRRLAEHVISGGSLFLAGRLPRRDTENRPCTVLADALGLSPGATVAGSARYFPSLVGHGPAVWMPETRVGWLDELTGAHFDPLFSDVNGRTCGVTTTAGAGRAVVVTTELPSHPALFTELFGWLGVRPGLELATTVPGVVATTTVSPHGERMVHLLNPTGYTATVQLITGDPTGLLDRPLTVPARTGWMLGLCLRLPAGAVLLSANAEVVGIDPDRVTFSRGLGEQTQVWLRTADGSRKVLAGPADQPLVAMLT